MHRRNFLGLSTLFALPILPKVKKKDNSDSIKLMNKPVEDKKIARTRIVMVRLEKNETHWKQIPLSRVIREAQKVHGITHLYDIKEITHLEDFPGDNRYYFFVRGYIE